ncbi:hypothetical protein PLESTB_000895000 [Pleodorina starrii]|uniref:Phosphate transporter n=1 Tax=Pleodorina starrii TaxID=330485 RepID=A0A9W6BN80_9CHLO|nr:hypothetical protein PLESTB_000895000 [Pleodorina starrii]GLC67020.1 hypothetical protein PLESTF_000502800 [Pleodorina starrii]
MRQALLIASVCEFSGSVLLGAEVTRTVAGGIARISVFDTEPEIYMYGMLCALVASGTWLLLATYLSLPVSTTHSTIGGVLGFAFVYGGPRAVTWLEPQDTFPYMGGLMPIILAWFTSPLMSGLASVVLFVIVRSAILRRARSLDLAIWCLPVLVLFTVFINLFFVLYTGAGARLTWDSNRAAWVSGVAAGGCCLLTALVGVPFMRQQVHRAAEARSRQSQSRQQEPATARPSLPSAPTTGLLPRVSSNTNGPAGGGTAGRGGGGGAAAAVLMPGLPATGSGARGTFGGATRSSFSRSTARVSEVSAVSQQPSRQGSSGRVDPWAAPQPQQHPQRQQVLLPECIPEATATTNSTNSSTTPASGSAAPSEAERSSSPPRPLRGTQPRSRSLSRQTEGQPPPPPPPPLPPVAQEQRPEGYPPPPPQQQQQQEEPLEPAAAGPQPLPPAPERAGPGSQLAEAPPRAPPAPHGGVLAPLGATGGGGGGHPGLDPPAAGQQPQDVQQQQQQQQQEHLLQQQQMLQWHLYQQQYQQQQQQGQLYNQQFGWWQQQQQQQVVVAAHQLPPQQQQQGGGGPGGQQQQQHQQQAPQQVQYWVDPYRQQLHWQQQLQQLQQQQLQQQQQELTPQQQMWGAQAQGHVWQAQGGHQAWLGQGLQQQQQQQEGIWNLQAAQNPQGRPQEGPENPFQRAHMESSADGEAADSAAAAAAAGRAGPVAESVEAGDWERQQRGESLGSSHPHQHHRRGEFGRGGAASAPSAQNAAAAAAVTMAAAADGSETTTSDGTGEGEQPRHQQSQAAQQQDRNSNHVQFQKTFDQLKAIVLRGTDVNVHDCVERGGDPVAVAIHAHAEVFDPSTEHAFKYLQVVTAICDSFSHGANDVANSVGPLAAIWHIYRYQRLDVDSEVLLWVLVLGGAGIVVGLALYGYNIIRAIGVRLSVVTPSRGFCIELSTALVVVLASKYGLPISTTHCQVGATAGMGLLEGSAGLNWPLAAQFFTGWLVTLLFTALMAAALFAAGAYAPGIQQGRAIAAYETQLTELASRLDLLLNRTNTAALYDPLAWGNYSAPLQSALEADMASLQLAMSQGSGDATRPVQNLPAALVLEWVGRAVESYLNNSLPYMGGMPARGQALPRWP